MSLFTPSTAWCARHALAAAALALTLPAGAQGAGAAKASADSRYQQERAACAAMAGAESRSNCLRDLGAARQQARRQPRAPVSQEVLERNALQRCQVHKAAEDRAICERLARGEGQVSGSVAGGGQIRSIETTVPAPEPPSPPLAPPTLPPPATSPPPMEPPPTTPPGAVPPLTAPVPQAPSAAPPLRPQ